MPKRKISNQDLAGPNSWCIAGGYAACPALAGDMDVWIYGIDKGVLNELLDGFDISTHACAFAADGSFIKGDNWTPIWVPPVVLFVGGLQTPARLQKITDRYAFLRGSAHAA